MAKKKNVDIAKQKAARQKKFVIGGSILLVIVFGYEAKTMLLAKKPVPPPVVQAAPLPAPGAAPNSLTPPGLPTPGATAAAPAAAAAGQLADTDIPPSSDSTGQLVSFGLFETKNPFAPQVRNTTPGSSSTSADAAGGSVPASGASAGSAATAADSAHADVAPTAPAGATVAPAAQTPAPAPASTPSSGTAPATTTTTRVPTDVVTIAVNGRAQQVGKDGTFPSGAPVFRLVSFTKTSAEVGIVGGSYASGGATLTLDKGKPVTLMNTSDGKRYKLELL
jgi:hypothetical protein